MEHRDERARTIFLHALEITASDAREAFLNSQCTEDEGLRAEVDELLRHHVEMGSFLDSPATIAPTAALPLAEKTGEIIGRYRLLERVGEGGFGVVFMAEQETPVRRKVALKIIKPGMDSSEVIARFEAERQALAMMDHPNIARVFDAGATDTGRPYFVMELVRGIPITTFCDQNSLTAGERLELFIKVCQAVQHAHQKGIIHRDIKPSNILVTMHDDKPVPKVIDFGVAKATNARLTERTLFTRFAQMIGTPLYMSPEQAQMSGLDIDTRSDIYSLGVLLYELLTGTTPFDQRRVHEAAHDELLRIIREEEPPLPSIRIGSLGETLPSVAAHRKVEPSKLSSLVRGELDWIVMKAMEKDRTRRYETASALAEDVQHHLQDEPVKACPPSVAYRFGKFARRNKAVLSGTCLLVMTLLLGLVGTLSQATKAKQQKTKTQQALFEAEKQRDRARGAERDAEREADIARRQAYIADMNVAMQAWRENDIVRVRQILHKYIPNDGEPDFRHFEWYHLWHLCSSIKARAIPLSYPIGDLVFSPNDQNLVVGLSNRSYAIVDLHTGQRTASFGPGNWIWSPIDSAFSPDGRVLACAVGRFVRLLQPDGSFTDDLKGHEGDVKSITFSPDGSHLASAEHNSGTIIVWDTKTKRAIRSLQAEKVRIRSIVWSPKGDVLAVSGSGNEVEIWNVMTGEQITKLNGHVESVGPLAFFSNGQFLATGSDDGTVRIWNWNTRETVHVLDGHADHVYGLAISPDDRWIVSGGRDNIVKIWSADTGEEIRVLKGHSGAVTTLAFSHSGEQLASSGSDRTVLLWDLCDLPPQDLVKTGDRVLDIAFSPDGKTLASISGGFRFLQHAHSTHGETKVDLWDTESRQLTDRLDIGRNVFSLAFGSDGLLAIGAEDGTIELWDWCNKRRVKSWLAHKQRVRDVAFSRDGQLLATASDDVTARIWNSTTGELLQSLEGHKDIVQSIAFSPDSTLLATASHDFTVALWETQSGIRKDVRNDYHAAALSVAFSTDGRQLASCSWDHTLRVWDLQNLDSQPRSIAGHSMWAACVCFSLDGKTLFSAAGDRTVKAWDVQTMQQKIVLNGHTKGVACLDISPDGRVLASGGRDGTIRFWRAPAPTDL